MPIDNPLIIASYIILDDCVPVPFKLQNMKIEEVTSGKSDDFTAEHLCEPITIETTFTIKTSRWIRDIIRRDVNRMHRQIRTQKRYKEKERRARLRGNAL